MLNICYKKSDYHNYISFIVSELPTMERKMLSHNEIEGLLPCHIQILEDKIEIDYEIDGKMSFCEFLENRMIGKKELNNFYENLLKTISNMRSYLIPINRLLLSPETIFVSGEGENLYFCCVPLYEKEMMEQIKVVTELLLKHTDHKDQEGVFFIYGLYQMLQQSNITVAMIEQYIGENGKSNCMKSMTKVEDSEFKKSLDIKSISWNNWEEIEKNVQVTKGDYDVDREYIRNSEHRYKPDKVVKKEKKNKKTIPKESDKKKVILHRIIQIGMLLLCLIFLSFTFYFYQVHSRKNFIVGVGISICSIVCFLDRERTYQKKEKEMLEKKEEFGNIKNRYKKRELEGDKTILLSCQELEEKIDNVPYLKPLSSTRDMILIGHTPLVLGSLEEAVDIVIQGRGVSRIHATIECERGIYYIRDLNSTNGTEWNGERIAPQIPQELQEGDTILIGTHQYRFMS